MIKGVTGTILKSLWYSQVWGMSPISQIEILKLQISAFFLFSNFQKRQIALYSPCHLVGWLVDVTIKALY